MSGVVDRRELAFKALGGLAGGAIGWLPVELASRGHTLTDTMSSAAEVASFGSMAVLSGVIGGMIIAVEAQTLAFTPKLRRSFARGFIICFILSLPAIYYSNLAFSALLSGGGWSLHRQGSLVYLVIARVIGWALMGLMLGAGVGIATFSLRNLLKGAAGGWVGGVIGGLLFDPINMMTSGGLLSRLVGTCAVGLVIGLFIGLVQELTKDAWLVVESGRLSGRQFRLEHSTVTLGRAEENVVGLFGDPSVQPRHAMIARQGVTWTLKRLAASGTTVNGQVIETATLRDGDRIGIGDYRLRFHTRQAATVSAAAPNPSKPAFIRTAESGSTASGVAARRPSLVDSAGRRYPIRAGSPTRLGRAPDNDIVVGHPSVSRHHAQIVASNGGFELRDLGSQNGTYVGGRRIEAARIIGDGDAVAFGDASFTFRV